MKNKIDNLHDFIYRQCEEELYYLPKVYQESSQRILNATILLYNKAANYLRENNSERKHDLKEIVRLLEETAKIMSEEEIIVTKEDEIRKLFVERNLNPEHYFILNKWDGNFMPLCMV